MPVDRQDELGKLEANLNEMADGLRASFRVVQEESDKVQGILGAMIEGVVVVSRFAVQTSRVTASNVSIEGGGVWNGVAHFLFADAAGARA